MNDTMTLIEIMKAWKQDSKVDRIERETIACHVCGDKLFVVTKHPGWFIGKQGWLVDKYRNTLKENGYPYDVRFVDLFCGDVREF